MKVQTVSQTGVGFSTPIVINTNTTPVNIGFGVQVSGTVTYSVMYSFDDPAIGFTNWFPTTVTGQLTAQSGSILFPVTAVALDVTSGTGTATMELVQAGIA